MRTKPKRRVRRCGPIRFNWSGLRLNSVTVDLWLWSGVLWERKR